MKAAAIIVGAGKGVRMNRATPKQFLLLGGRPIVAYALMAFDACVDVSSIVLVVPAGDLESCRRKIVPAVGLKKPVRIVAGGEERQNSVANGLAAVEPEAGVVVIHDAVRPFIDPEGISRCIAEADASGACIAAVPLSDTLKAVDGDFRVEKTLSRDRLWLAQTPQAFRVDIIKKAHDAAVKEGFRATDDAAMVERMGVRVRVIPGSRRNIKITDPEDLRMAEAMLELR